jgi:DNA polymerase-3 subunit gamma/tau
MKQTKAKLNKNNNELNKLLILEEADGLPKATQTVLRKFIKDKRNKTTYILTCNNINDLSKKLKSNYHKIILQKLKNKELVQNFIYILNKEYVKYEMETLKKIAYFSDGDMRIGINYLQSIANLYNEINEEYFFKIINLKNPLLDRRFIDICLEKDFYKVIEILDEIIEEGYSYIQIKMFYDECIIRMNYVKLKVSDVLRERLQKQIQLEKENNYDNISQIYGFFANVFSIIQKYYK